MADVRDLYQKTIIDHYHHPRNFLKIEGANRQAEGFNPLCGDRFQIYLRIENGVVADIGFTGTGCAISTASASMMTDALRGKTESEVRVLFEQFQQLVTGSVNSQADHDTLEGLAVFAGVREYPVRAKCAALAWHAMKDALEGNDEIAATE